MKKLVFVLALAVISSFSLSAQKQSNKDLYLKVKDDKKPLIFVDGKKFDFPMELIDQSKIKSASILSDKEAIEKYNTANGVILITTKFDDKAILSITKDESKNSEKPTIIIDGKISNQSALDALEPKQIEKMEVLKGEKAVEKYKSPGGVIIITTKK